MTLGNMGSGGIYRLGAKSKAGRGPARLGGLLYEDE